jgi:hypothetical protein
MAGPSGTASTSFSGVATFSLTIGATTAGNFLVVVIGNTTTAIVGGQEVISVKLHTSGQAFSRVNEINAILTTLEDSIWFLPNCPAGEVTIDVVLANARTGAIVYAQFNGMGATSTQDGGSGSTASTSTGVTSLTVVGSAASTVADDLWIGGFCVDPKASETFSSPTISGVATIGGAAIAVSNTANKAESTSMTWAESTAIGTATMGESWSSGSFAPGEVATVAPFTVAGVASSFPAGYAENSSRTYLRMHHRELLERDEPVRSRRRMVRLH